jgi:hypothetical protein
MTHIIGWLAASIRVIVQGWLLDAWIFVANNAAMVLTAIFGQAIRQHPRDRP